jgi:ribosomal protein L11 methyltransferase
VAQREALAELLWQIDTLGFIEKEREETLCVEAYFSANRPISSFRSDIAALLAESGVEPSHCAAAVQDFDPGEWLEKYRSSFREFAVGDRFFIYPPWREPCPGYPVNIVLEPTMAFGTGTHESTQLAMLALEPVLPDTGSMLDVGTGSGILSIAASGIKPGLPVTAFDIDELATKAALQNFHRNQIRDVQLFVGDTTVLKSKFDLVVANLTLEILQQLAGELIRLSHRNLIVSGFMSDHSEDVLQLFERVFPFQTSNVLVMNEWACLHLQYATTPD